MIADSPGEWKRELDLRRHFLRGQAPCFSRIKLGEQELLGQAFEELEAWPRSSCSPSFFMEDFSSCRTHSRLTSS